MNVPAFLKEYYRQPEDDPDDDFYFDHPRGDPDFEEVRDEARRAGLPEPTDGRAWGAVLQRARRAGLIEPAGTRKAVTSNLSPKVLWAATDSMRGRYEGG